MVNYYKTLKVSPNASTAEIKSAYRRLARKLHPDVNKNSEKATRDFATIVKAYEILSNPQERAFYDTQMLKTGSNGTIHSTDSVFNSDNSHAQKLRQMAIERRYNEIVDQMIEAERTETLAWQRVIFPIVALFASTFFVGIFKPNFFAPSFFDTSNIIGKLVLVTLFIVAILHLTKRLRFGFERFTYNSEDLHESILDGDEPLSNLYSRPKAIIFLVAGVVLSLGIGVLIGNYFESSVALRTREIFSHSLQPESIFYPPIIVLLVDIMHLIAAKFERHAPIA